ncbi:MAG: hypothetical protein OXC26_06770 [Albidovulum sp.]|nr:hypothetical protein [Albidovulum sp.]
MRKPPPHIADEPLDIFDDDRFAAALAGATRPTAAAPDAPEQPHPARAHSATPDARPPSRASTPVTARRRTAAQAPSLPEPNVPLKFRVPQSLRSEFHRFKAELAAVLGGVALDDSNLARPLVELFLVEQSERILKEASTYRGQIKRPPNGDAVGMAEFDHALGDIFRRAARQRVSRPSSKSRAS